MAGPDRRAAVPDVTVTGVTLRAQDVLPGDLFVAPGSAARSRCSPMPRVSRS
ncbi:hypothetical protein PICSAR10_04623 [Mycobacterium avium subsp. paratuberculosis]|nr:hypothetical protein PICSAR10_04623 [Mycobacterium avium subsp. paratuberculosis]